MASGSVVYSVIYRRWEAKKGRQGGAGVAEAFIDLFFRHIFSFLSSTEPFHNVFSTRFIFSQTSPLPLLHLGSSLPAHLPSRTISPICPLHLLFLSWRATVSPSCPSERNHTPHQGPRMKTHLTHVGAIATRSQRGRH